MARIPQEELEQLKKEIPLQQLAEARGVVAMIAFLIVLQPSEVAPSQVCAKTISA